MWLMSPMTVKNMSDGSVEARATCLPDRNGGCFCGLKRERMSHCGLYRTEARSRGRTDDGPGRLAEASEHARQRIAPAGGDDAQTTRASMRGIQLHEAFQAPNVTS